MSSAISARVRVAFSSGLDGRFITYIFSNCRSSVKTGYSELFDALRTPSVALSIDPLLLIVVLSCEGTGSCPVYSSIKAPKLMTAPVITFQCACHGRRLSSSIVKRGIFAAKILEPCSVLRLVAFDVFWCDGRMCRKERTERFVEHDKSSG